MYRPFLAIATAALVAGCQSGGKDGVLGSVANADGDKAKVAAAYAPNAKGGYKGTKGENPHDKGRLRNTRTELTGYCPGVRVREGTNVLRVFPDGSAGDEPIRYQATIAKAARDCEYEGENLKIRVGVRGRIINGPDGATGSFPMPIRVAVLEGKRTVYSRLHKAKGKIAPGTSNALFSYVDQEVVIPAPRKTNVRIYVGFDEGPPKKR